MLYKISIDEEEHLAFLQVLSELGVKPTEPDLDIESLSIKGMHISIWVTEHYRAELTEEQLLLLKLKVNVKRADPCYTIAP